MQIDLKSIEAKLNVIIALLLEKQSENKKPEVETIHMLKKLGLENSDIAILLDKNTRQITKQLYKAKKRIK